MPTTLLFRLEGASCMTDDGCTLRLDISFSESGGGVVAETTIDGLLYASDVQSCDLLRDMTDQQFAAMHARYPPTITKIGDDISVRYVVDFLHDDMLFVMQPECISGFSQITELHLNMAKRVNRIERDILQLRVDRWLADEAPPPPPESRVPEIFMGSILSIVIAVIVYVIRHSQ